MASVCVADVVTCECFPEPPAGRSGLTGASTDQSQPTRAPSTGAPLTRAKVTQVEDMKVLLPKEQIRQRVAELGRQITEDYAVYCKRSENPQKLVLLSVLKGSFIFAADLARHIRLPLRVEFLGVQSYGDLTHSSGVVQITLDVARPIEGEHVLIVEDIVDTGLTSHYLLEQLATRKPKSLRLCTLLHKPARCQKEVHLDYVGFTIEDEYVIGYGLDHAQRYRNLPDVRILPADMHD